ncbi:hypothetical protein [Microvirga arsenatis]|uniref:Transcriptional regulator n=1 Tax=Microvirga arsenatis TaxID=2692265 RepID=A0ABW9YX68_9HYPH|nr:hypothetical protein [Microvirga arsenatis]NBJ13331.1 hypothetical protein [Microvirga arsenatis]NBJ24115.1 hypothetical protein [Microvirga arsenatis]
MATIKAILTKPLDGDPEGTEREFSQADFDRLKARGAVRAATDGGEKAVPKVANKAAPAVANKSAGASKAKA